MPLPDSEMHATSYDPARVSRRSGVAATHSGIDVTCSEAAKRQPSAVGSIRLGDSAGDGLQPRLFASTLSIDAEDSTG